MMIYFLKCLQPALITFLLLGNTFSILAQKADQESPLMLATDRNFYFAGDLIWYRIFLTDRSFNNRFSREILYIHLLDQKGNTLTSQVLDGQEGTYQNGLQVPADISTGYYFLAAYQNDQKSPEAPYFRLPLFLANPEKPEYASTENTIQLNYPPRLVQGLPNRVYYSGAGTWSAGYSLQIINDLGETVVNQVLKEPSGYFGFIPEAGKSYRVDILAGDQLEKTLNLPEVQPHGSFFHSSATESGELSILVSTTTNNSELKITAQKEEVLKQQISREYYLQPEELPTGLFRIELIDSSGTTLSIANFYKPDEKVVVEAKLKNIYNTREKIEPQFRITDGGTTVAADFSVSVLPAFYAQGESAYNNYLMSKVVAQTDLLDQNDLPFNIGQQSTGKLNLLLEINALLKSKENKVSEQKLPDPAGLSISGQVLNTPAEGEFVSLTLPKNNPSYSYKRLRNGPEFDFEVLNFRGQQTAYLRSWPGSRISASFQGLSGRTFSVQPDFSRLKAPVNLNSWFELEYKFLAIQNTYTESPFQWNWQDQVSTTQSIELDADDLFYLSEYQDFPDMESVMREIVVGTIIRQKKSGYKIRILNRENKLYFRRDPFIVIDGFPSDNQALMQLNPEDVQAIAISRPPNSLYDFGQQGDYGVINVFTHKRNFRPADLDRYQSVQVQGFSEQYSFNVPDHQDTSFDFPDFRKLIYWNPNITTDLKGKTKISYYHSDDTGSFLIMVKGITAQGKPFEASFPYSVSLEPQ
jgi:hypothetical protein